MSLIKFELKNEHIKLIKQIKWDVIAFPHIKQEANTNTPFTFGETILQDVGVILHGFDGKKILPDNAEDPHYTQEEIDEMKKLYEELPMALNIVCFFGEFTPGWYKTKSYVRDWKKMEKPNISE